MATTKKRLAIATAIVWTCALGSAGALAYVLDRPLVPRGSSELVAATAPPRSAVDEAVAPAVRPAPVVIIPTVTITAAAPRPVVKKVAFPPVRDISEMNCTQWHPLTMGSGNVQVCE
jgi:hypothetical protein